MARDDSSSVRCRITLRATPGARQSGITSLDGEELGVRVGAPPVEGKANEEVVSFLDEVLGSSARGVTLVSGSLSRSKIIEFSWSGDVLAVVAAIKSQVP